MRHSTLSKKEHERISQNVPKQEQMPRLLRPKRNTDAKPNGKPADQLREMNKAAGGQSHRAVTSDLNESNQLIVEEDDHFQFEEAAEKSIADQEEVAVGQNEKSVLAVAPPKPRESIVKQINYVHPAHQNFNMVFNIMLGIKKSVDATFQIPMYEPTDKDFKIRCKYEIAPYKTSTDDIVKACSFFDYAPQIFANIRKTSGITKQQYAKSLGPENILECMFTANFQTLSELCSSGKSGSFFYYSPDAKFVLKTIPREEFKFVKRMLKNYHDYITIRNAESFMCRVYGLHKVIFYRKKGKMSKKLYFCTMNNVFQTSRKIDLRYDLKGSTFGRRTIKLEQGYTQDRTIALKDLDLIDRKETFKVGANMKERILEVLKMDADFFAENSIIDYSLLVGVHNRSEHPSTFLSRRHSDDSELGLDDV